MNNVTPRSLGIAVAGFWLAVSLASTAAADAPSSTTAASEAVVDDPMICKKSAVTGSRVRTNKVCMTKSQWEALSRNSQEFMKGVQRNGAQGPGGEALPNGG
jgi:hypothetical protein